MRLNDTLKRVARNNGLSKMATSNIEELAQFSVGDFSKFKKDEPPRRFSHGGPHGRGTGPEWNKPKQREAYRPNYKVGWSAYEDTSFLGQVSDYWEKGTAAVEQGWDWLSDSWLGRGVEIGWDWVNSGSGQTYIDNLIDRYKAGQLQGGAPGVQQGRFMSFRSSVAGSVGGTGAQITAAGRGRGGSVVEQALAQATLNPKINPAAASFINSEMARVQTAQLPEISTPISIQKKIQYYTQPAPTTTIT
jgi:hypothetical protein